MPIPRSAIFEVSWDTPILWENRFRTQVTIVPPRWNEVRLLYDNVIVQEASWPLLNGVFIIFDGWQPYEAHGVEKLRIKMREAQ